MFGSVSEQSGTERLIILAETKQTVEAIRDRINQQITQLAIELIGAPADEIVLVPPRTVLKTSSGKIRRSACRDLYLKGYYFQKRRFKATLYIDYLRSLLISFGRRRWLRTLRSHLLCRLCLDDLNPYSSFDLASFNNLSKSCRGAFD